MQVEDIIRKNKLKRQSYLDKSPKKSNNINTKISYLKGLISRILLSIIFVLGSIIFTNIDTKNKELFKTYVLENSLAFNKINKIYKRFLGNVDIVQNKEQTVFNNIDYSNIENYKNGVKLKVKENAPINVITSGIVVFVGEKDNLGNTIIIQGNDGVDIWYSNITDINIAIYDYVEAGMIIGNSNSDFIYLTLNKDGKSISYEEYQKLS